MKILLVDDEIELTEPLGRLLQRQGYQVDVATDGDTGGQLIQANGYDLLILDWMLPRKSGIELCQQVRHGDSAACASTTPILLLTAKDTLDDRVLGLDSGADDYLVKPFELRELLARVRALLRRSPNLEVPSQLLKFQDLTLDPANQLAYRQGQSIELSDKESKLLAYLMKAPNQVLSHEQIYQAVWGEQEAPSSNVLAAQMRLLRRKIEPKGTPAVIHTVYGKGYRFGD